MYSVFKRLAPLAKHSVHFSNRLFKRNPAILVSRFSHVDQYFFVDEQSELSNPEYNEISNEYLGTVAKGHTVLVIQPYIKWGRNKKTNTNRDLQLAEAVALVETLPYWSVADSVCVPLMSYEKKLFFGTGNLQLLKTRIQSGKNISAVFISINTLQHIQIFELQKEFGVPVYDRYSLVIHIFRNHAKSPEAKLQVALAELPYIYQKMSDLGGQFYLLEKWKLFLQSRESKLKTALKKLRVHRETIRTKRKNHGFVTVAVVGYTNAGKTSLIKALTGDKVLQPKNYLFATLDTTAHEGLLPCRMKVLYMDTIGFIQDVPETLIEPFNATLQDAMVADIIVHVLDVSHPDRLAQIEHVRKTLKTMVDNNSPIIEIANKCDLIEPEEIPPDMLAISATKTTGIDLLRQNIQDIVLSETGRSIMKMRVESGTESLAWLYKETTIMSAEPDPKNGQFLLLDVIMSEQLLYRFRRFLKQKANF